MRRALGVGFVVVALLLAGCTVPTASVPDGSPSETSLSGSDSIGGAPANETTPVPEESTDDESTIETVDFEPTYNESLVLRRVERLRGLEATGTIYVHEYPREEQLPMDLPNQFAGIEPAGAMALQLYSAEPAPVNQPLGIATMREGEVHIYLMNASDLRTEYGDSQEIVLAHEFVHALQYQHGLLDPGVSEEVTTDERLARIAIYEGDAMVVMERYRAEYAPMTPSAVEPMNETLLRAEWTNSLLRTPYYYGYRYFDEGEASPAALDENGTDPPETTAEILHGTDVEIREDALSGPDEDVSVRTTDRVGELTIRHTLRLNGFSFGEATSAADGWEGDRMYYLEGNDSTIHWVTAWENESAAIEFATTWHELLERRGGEANEGTVTVPGTEYTPELHYSIERDGSVVRITA